MQAITTAFVLALPVDMGEVTESSDSDEVAPCLFLCFALAGRKLPQERREKSLQEATFQRTFSLVRRTLVLSQPFRPSPIALKQERLPGRD